MGNPANLFSGDLVKILGASPFMAKAMADCPDDEWQKVDNLFNALMWQMVDQTMEATRRRALREIQINNKVYVPEQIVELKQGSHPSIYEKDGTFFADCEMPDGTKKTVAFIRK